MADVKFYYSAANKTQSETQQKAAALELINNTNDQDITIYTDGSAVNSNNFGGAGLHNNGAQRYYQKPLLPSW